MKAQGVLSRSLGRKVSSAGFHSPKSCPWRRRRNLNPPGFGTKNVRSGVRVGEVQKKNKTNTLQEQITFNEARRGSSQISELQSILKEISSGCSLEGLMLKLKLQYFSHLM